ncbi:MAG: DUF447 domain-containing protein [Haloferacaceae archaeon]
MSDDWPVEWSGVTESVTTTLGPNGRWNVAALGLHAPRGETGGRQADEDPVTATTWGRTRTRRNFVREGGGVVQFVTDPRDFVDAALSVREEDDPVLDSAAAWVRVDAVRLSTAEEGGTETVTWALEPTASTVRERRVPAIDRGFAAVVDATVAASRLDVESYETDALLDRLEYFAGVVDSCGGPRVREAFARVDEYAGWRDRR